MASSPSLTTYGFYDPGYVNGLKSQYPCLQNGADSAYDMIVVIK